MANMRMQVVSIQAAGEVVRGTASLEHVETYRGHEIRVSYEQSMGGWHMTYRSVFAARWECMSDFTSGEDGVPYHVSHLRERVDSALDGDDAWGLHKYLSQQHRASLKRWHRKPGPKMRHGLVVGERGA